MSLSLCFHTSQVRENKEYGPKESLALFSLLISMPFILAKPRSTFPFSPSVERCSPDQLDCQPDWLKSFRGISQAHFWVCLGRSWRQDFPSPLPLSCLSTLLLHRLRELSILALSCPTKYLP